MRLAFLLLDWFVAKLLKSSYQARLEHMGHSHYNGSLAYENFTTVIFTTLYKWVLPLGSQILGTQS